VIFEARDLSFRYRSAGRDALCGVSLGFAAGRHTAIVGPNGAGKSTLLHLLLGLAMPDRGEVLAFGRPSRAWGRRELARRVAVVGQEAPPDFPLTVREFVQMGRHPYIRPWGSLGRDDLRAVDAALERTGLTELAGRDLSQLSAGEFQRTRLGRALAQTPEALLLDEPTVHLDVGHEVEMFRLVAELVTERRIAAITVTHNLNLASRFADGMVLLAEGRVMAVGAAREVLRSEPLERAFGCSIEVLDLGDLGIEVLPAGVRGDR